jgi:hypothetical protein
MRLACLTLDLLRLVPIATLEILGEIVRQGRKIPLVAMSSSARHAEFVRAGAQKVLVAAPLLPENGYESRLDVPGPDCCRELNADERMKSPLLAGARRSVGVSSARLADATGCFGRAAQSLTVERR